MEVGGLNLKLLDKCDVEGSKIVGEPLCVLPFEERKVFLVYLNDHVEDRAENVICAVFRLFAERDIVRDVLKTEYHSVCGLVKTVFLENLIGNIY